MLSLSGTFKRDSRASKNSVERRRALFRSDETEVQDTRQRRA